MKMLITGGLGHIGSYISYFYGGLTIVDNLSTQRYCSLNGFSGTFIEEDFGNLSAEFLSDFDVIIHLGAITNAQASMSNAAEVYDVNVTKTLRMINKIGPNTLLIFPSSTSVYGTAASIVTEDDKYINPQSPYAESKVEVEQCLKALSNKLNYIIFRFGTIFGTSSGMRFHTAVNKFCYQARFGQPLTVWRDNVTMFRPYLGLSDAMRAIRMAIKNEIPTRNVYNVLTGNYTLETILDVIKKEMDININYVDTPLINQHSYHVSNDKITKLGWSPKDSIETEIFKTLNWLGA